MAASVEVVAVTVRLVLSLVFLQAAWVHLRQRTRFAGVLSRVGVPTFLGPPLVVLDALVALLVAFGLEAGYALALGYIVIATG